MSYYDRLGLDREASDAQIRRAYRRLARRWHPDLNPGNAEAAQQYAAITEAYDTLVDPVRRRAYDASGRAPTPVTAAPAAFAGFDFSLTVQGAQASTFGDLFVDVFRDAAVGARVPGRGGDLTVTLTLTLADVLHGTTRTLPVQRRVACGLCQGVGVLDAPPTACRGCGGSGEQRLGRGHMVFVRSCEGCGGQGVVRQRTCHGCHGHGMHEATEVVSILVPPGLADGDELVQAGQGHAGARGGAPGDLRVRIHVAADAHLTRHGDDLHLTLPVAIHEAVLGARLPVPTLDGVITVRVPPGTQTGQRLRLRDRGLPNRRGDGRGDLVLEVRLVLPPVIDARGRALMQEFGRLHPEDVREAWWAGAFAPGQSADRNDARTEAAESRLTKAE